MRKFFLLVGILLSVATQSQTIRGSVYYVTPKTNLTYLAYPNDSSIVFIDRTTGRLYRTHVAGGGSSITGSGAAGQVTYWDGASSITGTNNNFWDNGNTLLRINGTSSIANVHLQLGDSASTKAFLPPRVQDTANIASPRQGMFLYQIKDAAVYYRTLTAWIKVAGNTTNAPNDSLGVYWPLGYRLIPIVGGNFPPKIGTSSYYPSPFTIGTNSIDRLTFRSDGIIPMSAVDDRVLVINTAKELGSMAKSALAGTLHSVTTNGDSTTNNAKVDTLTGQDAIDHATLVVGDRTRSELNGAFYDVYGNSITTGFGYEGYPHDSSYCSRLAFRWGLPMTNHAIPGTLLFMNPITPGTSMEDFLPTTRNYVTGSYISMMFGTNEGNPSYNPYGTPATYKAAWHKIIDTLHLNRGYPYSHIILEGVPFQISSAYNVHPYKLVEDTIAMDYPGLTYINNWDYMLAHGDTINLLAPVGGYGGGDSVHLNITFGHRNVFWNTVQIMPFALSQGKTIFNGGVHIKDTTQIDSALVIAGKFSNITNPNIKLYVGGETIFGRVRIGSQADAGRNALLSLTVGTSQYGLDIYNPSLNSAIYTIDASVLRIHDLTGTGYINYGAYGVAAANTYFNISGSGITGASIAHETVFNPGQDASYGSVKFKSKDNATFAIFNSPGNNAAIGTWTPDASALLDLTSTTKGFLPPRQDIEQRNAISSPATGLQVYNTTTKAPEWYNGYSWGNSGLQQQPTRVTTQFNKTSSTTLSDISELMASLIAGKTYRFEAKLYTTSNSAGGVKVAIGGTATATAIIYEGLTTDAGLTTQSRGTAMAATVGAVTAVTAAYISITGTITVNAAGTLTVQFAQNASNGTASSVLVGSTFVVTEIL